ncbi:MAG TPA: hypothetical protein VLB32_05010 [Candidatus Acidoferrales bacterium]|jgi:hypothetical protein|nr:hypothetical protein [Candidatus Acidoferrales bacterium]
MEKVFRCMQCDLPEEKCPCPRYCILCQNPETVRLVGDGLYYCADCREACEYRTQDELGH